jgi:Chalcone isomerase-like
MKRITGIKAFIAALLLAVAAHADAMTIADKTLDDTARVGDQVLVLNGAGMRTKFFFQVYIGALYLRERVHTLGAVLADKGPKRIELYVMRHVGADRFVDAFRTSINNNLTPGEYRAVSARLARFEQGFAAIGAVDEDSVVLLDYLPHSDETVLTVNGKERVRIPGADFYGALLKVWLGDHPAQDSLKKAMLGE